MSERISNESGIDYLAFMEEMKSSLIGEGFYRDYLRQVKERLERDNASQDLVSIVHSKLEDDADFLDRLKGLCSPKGYLEAEYQYRLIAKRANASSYSAAGVDDVGADDERDADDEPSDEELIPDVVEKDLSTSVSIVVGQKINKQIREILEGADSQLVKALLNPGDHKGEFCSFVNGAYNSQPLRNEVESELTDETRRYLRGNKNLIEEKVQVYINTLSDKYFEDRKHLLREGYLGLTNFIKLEAESCPDDLSAKIRDLAYFYNLFKEELKEELKDEGVSPEAEPGALSLSSFFNAFSKIDLALEGLAGDPKTGVGPLTEEELKRLDTIDLDALIKEIKDTKKETEESEDHEDASSVTGDGDSELPGDGIDESDSVEIDSKLAEEKAEEERLRLEAEAKAAEEKAETERLRLEAEAVAAAAKLEEDAKAAVSDYFTAVGESRILFKYEFMRQWHNHNKSKNLPTFRSEFETTLLNDIKKQLQERGKDEALVNAVKQDWVSEKFKTGINEKDGKARDTKICALASTALNLCNNCKKVVKSYAEKGESKLLEEIGNTVAGSNIIDPNWTIFSEDSHLSSFCQQDEKSLVRFQGVNFTRSRSNMTSLKGGTNKTPRAFIVLLWLYREAYGQGIQITQKQKDGSSNEVSLIDIILKSMKSILKSPDQVGVEELKPLVEKTELKKEDAKTMPGTDSTTDLADPKTEVTKTSDASSKKKPSDLGTSDGATDKPGSGDESDPGDGTTLAGADGSGAGGSGSTPPSPRPDPADPSSSPSGPASGGDPSGSSADPGASGDSSSPDASSATDKNSGSSVDLSVLGEEVHEFLDYLNKDHARVKKASKPKELETVINAWLSQRTSGQPQPIENIKEGFAFLKLGYIINQHQVNKKHLDLDRKISSEFKDICQFFEVSPSDGSLPLVKPSLVEAKGNLLNVSETRDSRLNHFEQNDFVKGCLEAFQLMHPGKSGLDAFLSHYKAVLGSEYAQLSSIPSRAGVKVKIETLIKLCLQGDAGPDCVNLTETKFIPVDFEEQLKGTYNKSFSTADGQLAFYRSIENDLLELPQVLERMFVLVDTANVDEPLKSQKQWPDEWLKQNQVLRDICIMALKGLANGAANIRTGSTTSSVLKDESRIVRWLQQKNPNFKNEAKFWENLHQALVKEKTNLTKQAPK